MARRPLDVVVGSLSALLALALSALVGFVAYRIVHDAIKYRTAPLWSDLFALIPLAIAVALWVLAVRLFRGVGYRSSGQLLGPAALKVAAITLVAWTVFIVWASIDLSAYPFLLLAIPAPPLALAAWRRAIRSRERRTSLRLPAA